MRAVLGDVATMRLGWTSAHEQLIARLPSWIEGPDLHMGFRPDPAYLLEVAATGVRLGFDPFSKLPYLPDEAPGRAHLARRVVPLARDGDDRAGGRGWTERRRSERRSRR